MDNEEEKKKKNYSYGIQLSHRSLILTHFHGTLWSKPHGMTSVFSSGFCSKNCCCISHYTANSNNPACQDANQAKPSVLAYRVLFNTERTQIHSAWK